MRALIHVGIVCVGIVYATSTWAEPRIDVRTAYQRALKLANSGAAEQALAVIEEGLVAAPRNLPLLGLKGTVLLSLYDHAGALAAYQVYLDAGARGANRREAQKIVDSLRTVQSTFIEVTVADAPATIFLDTTTRRPLCVMTQSCNKPVLPGQYRLIVERRGFERWTGAVTVDSGKISRIAVTLVESPSLVTVRVAQPGAHITIDDKTYDAPTSVPAGKHRIVVSLAGHMTTRFEAIAHEGKPVEFDVALRAIVPVTLSPPGARLVLDGKAVTLSQGTLVVPPGAHVLVASAPGFSDGRVEIPAVRGDGYQLTLTLARDVPTVPVMSSGRLSTTRRKVAIAVGGVSVAALAGGVVLGLQSRRLDHDTYMRCPSPSAPCPVASEANDLNHRARTRALQANVAFGVAGGAAIAAAALWFIGAPESPISVTPRLGSPGEAGIDLAVRF